MKDRLILVAKIAFTLALLYFLYSKIDWHEFRRTLRHTSVLWVTAALAIHYISYFWSVARWKIILDNFRIQAPFTRLVRYTFIGGFFNLFLPSMVGGDFFRAFLLARDEQRRLTTTLTSTILDRSAGFIALLTIGTVFAGMESVTIRGVRIFPALAVLTGVFLLANIIVFSEKVHQGLDALLRRHGMLRSVERLDAVVDGLKALSRNPRALVKSLFISFGVQFLSVMIVWFIGWGLHVNVPFIYFLIFVPIISIITMIPLTINGIGLREGSFYLLFSQAGLSPESCVSMGLLFYLVMVLTALPGGLLYSLDKAEGPLSKSLNELGSA